MPTAREEWCQLPRILTGCISALNRLIRSAKIKKLKRTLIAGNIWGNFLVLRLHVVPGPDGKRDKYVTLCRQNSHLQNVYIIFNKELGKLS